MGARTSYFAQSSATATRATAVFTSAVSFANTPSNNVTVLYIGSTEVLGSTSNTPYQIRIRDNTNSSTLSTTHFIPTQTLANSAESYVATGIAFVTYTASPGSQSLSVEVRSCAATNVLQRSNSYLWGLELGPNDQFIDGGATVTTASGDTWVTAGSQLTVSVATSGSYIIVSYAECSADLDGNSNTAVGTKFRMLMDGSALSGFLVQRVAATSLSKHFIYMGTESWAAGSHTVNVQGAYGGDRAGNVSKVYNVRHAVLEVSAFQNSYVTAEGTFVSGNATSFTTSKSFTATIADSAAHAILTYGAVGTLSSGGAAAEPARHRILHNTEDVAETGATQVLQATSAIYAQRTIAPFIVAINTTLAAASFNVSLQGKNDTASRAHTVDRWGVAILQLASTAAGGPTTFNQSGNAVTINIASVQKQVNKTVAVVNNNIATATKTWLRTLAAVTQSIASITTGAVFAKSLSAVNNNVATAAEAFIHAIAANAVTNSIATVQKTAQKTIGVVTNSIATIVKLARKTIAVLNNNPATTTPGPIFANSQIAINTNIAAASETIVSASAAPVSAAEPYVLHLGEGVKRFTGLIAYSFGLGKGTVSDRDPDS